MTPSTILAIDPGPQRSAAALMQGMQIKEVFIEDNEKLLLRIGCASRLSPFPSHLAIEKMACYGMPVGDSIFETCEWIGRFTLAARPMPNTRIYRREVKLYLCNSARAKDANVRRAIIDKYPATGGGKTPQIGTKAKPGPLYGVKADMWSAIGVGLTWYAREVK